MRWAHPSPALLTLEGIPVLGLVDTGASVTCLGFSVWWRYRSQWGPLKPFGGTVHGAHGKPLQTAGKTQLLDLQWGKARGRACFIVILGLESPPCLNGMDITRPLRVRIDVTNGTVTPAQPDPQTIHLNAAQQQRKEKSPPSAAPLAAPPAAPPAAPSATHQPLSSPPQEIAPPAATPHTASRALLLQSAEIPPRPLPQPMAHRGRLFLPRGRSTGIRDWDPRAFQRSGIMDSHSQSPARASLPALWAEYQRPRGRDHCQHALLNLSTRTSASPPRARASLIAPAATAERPLQGVQRCVQPRRGRPRLYSAAGAHHRDARAFTPPTLPASKPSCSTGGDGAGPADASQQHHPPLQQSLGFAGGNGKEKRR